MKRHLFLLPIAVALVLSACKESPAPVAKETKTAAEVRPGQVEIPADSPQLKQIVSAPVEELLVPVGNVNAPAKIEANVNRLSHVVLPLAGRITSVAVKIGDYVNQGQALLTVESPDADAAVANYQQAQSAVTQTRSALAKAQTDLDREKDLFENGAVPQKEVLNAQAVLVQAQTQVEQALATMEQTRGRLKILGIAGGSYGQKVNIYAPLSGKVLEMSVVNGEFRNDLSAPLLTIADLSSVWVSSDVAETAIRLVKPGEAVAIDLSAYPNEVFRGKVTLISDLVDPQTRTVKVRAELANPGGRFKPEMFGNMRLTAENELRPTVPASAVIATDGKAVVWREKKKGSYEKVAVTTGERVGSRITILSGLSAKDIVVVDGVMLLAAY